MPESGELWVTLKTSYHTYLRTLNYLMELFRETTVIDSDVGKSWTHLLLWAQHIYNCIWKNSLWKLDEHRVSTTKDKRTALRQVEKADRTGQGKNTPSLYHNPQSGRIMMIYFACTLRNLSSTSCTLFHRSCRAEMSPQNIRLWKRTENISRKLQL